MVPHLKYGSLPADLIGRIHSTTGGDLQHCEQLLLLSFLFFVFLALVERAQHA